MFILNIRPSLSILPFILLCNKTRDKNIISEVRSNRWLGKIYWFVCKLQAIFCWKGNEWLPLAKHVMLLSFISIHNTKAELNQTQFNYFISIISKLCSLFTALHLSKMNIKHRKQISCLRNQTKKTKTWK